MQMKENPLSNTTSDYTETPKSKIDSITENPATLPLSSQKTPKKYEVLQSFRT